MSNGSIYELQKGVNLALIKNKKFKSVVISFNFCRNIEKSEVTGLSLLNNIMVAGCNKYKNIKEISKLCDELYGLTISNYTTKVGEKYISTFRFRFPSDVYLNESIFEDVLLFCNELIFNTRIEDGKINPEIIDIEKNILIDEIESKIDSKTYYAMHRCIEKMCESEPYCIDESGYVDDIAGITAEGLYSIYTDLLSKSSIFISIEGDFDKDKALEIIDKNYTFSNEDRIMLKREEYCIIPKETRYEVEDLGCAKANIVVGYRALVDYKDIKKYYGLLIGNTILGATPSSKLFRNIREKESMCYFIGSSLNKYKSILMVYSGIDHSNYDSVLGMIRREIDDLKNGNFDEKDIEYAKEYIINSIETSYNSRAGESMYIFNQYISDTDIKVEDIIDIIKNTNKDDIVSSVKDITEDMVYLLK